mmetsp:Transcript_21579/g.32801  ORF Transcript_21579/g.32801 Transcript_21579/m.32801 type:complete len:226 (-) Transcript_21579:477-1154(-)
MNCHAANALETCSYYLDYSTRCNLIGMDITTCTLCDIQSFTIRTQRHTTWHVNTIRKDTLFGTFPNRIFKTRQTITVNRIFLTSCPSKTATIGIHSEYLICTRNGYINFSPRRMDDHASMHALRSTSEFYLDITTNGSNGVVHAAGTMRLLIVKSYQLTMFSISSCIKSPVDVSIGSDDLWIMGHSDARWSLVQHIRMQKVAWFFLATFVSNPIDSIPIVGIRVV